MPLQKLISCLYESMTDPENSPAFIELFAEQMRATTGAILVMTDLGAGSSQVLAAARIDPSYRNAYEQYYGSINVYVARLREMRTHKIVQPGEAICPDEELVKTEYYNDYMRPQRLFYSLGMAMRLAGNLHVHLGATRSKPNGPFGADEYAVAEAVAAHLAPAFHVRERFLRAQCKSAALTSLADALPFGVLVLAGTGKILEANRRAAEILRAGDGLSSSGGELAASSPADHSALCRLVGRALATGLGRSLAPGGAARISRRSGFRAYNVLVTPLRAGLHARLDPARTAVVLVVVIDPEHEPGMDSAKLCQLFDLTPAEGRVCVLLAGGKPPREIAAALGITLNTVRTHIKRILAKTETSRLPELVRLLLSSSPLSGACDAFQNPQSRTQSG